MSGKTFTPTDELEQTHVGTEMSAGVVSCAPGDRVIALATRMAIYRTHAVVIAGLWNRGGEDEVLWGTIAHEQVAGALAEGRYDDVAADLASRRASICGVHESMLTAARRMHAGGVDHLVVLDDADDPVGVISTLDVMRVASR